MVFPTSDHPRDVAPLELASRRVPSLALYPGETLAIGIPRIAEAQLDWMLHLLRREPNREYAVHQARKAAKRVRGVLRLVRGELGQFRYRQENVVIRDVARRLSPVRTSAVMVETVDAFAASERDPLSSPSHDHLRTMLSARHTQLTRAVLEHPQLMTDVIVTLLTARSRYRAWPVARSTRNPQHPDVRAFRDSYNAIAPGLALTYSRGRTAMQHAAVDRSMHPMHIWRKRVKYLSYELKVFGNIRPEITQALATDLGTLGSQLGQEHDYAELGEMIASEPSYIPDPRERFRYLSALVAHRMELQADALRNGARLFDETPDAFIDRLGVHWNASRL